MQINDLNQKHFNILMISTLRSLIRKGIITKEDIVVEIAQQGVPAEWAISLVSLVNSLPDLSS